jgi:tripartite-type tricarboxylate transporter receptor subunit TctC
LKRLSGIPFLIVPYKSGGPAIVAVMQGESQIMIATQSTAMGFIKSGKVKVLAAASKKRLPLFEDVPTFQEAGLPALDLGPWDGLVAPASTPPAIIDLIYRHVAKALAQPEVASALANHGFEIVGSTPAEFGEHIRQELAMLRQVFKGGVWKLSAVYSSKSP